MSAMEHQEAINTYAAEGYLLDELPEAERTAFEEHFADCDACFADVRDGLRFTAVVPKVAGHKTPSGWGKYFAVAAAAATFAVAVEQVAFIAPLRGQLANVRAALAREREPRQLPIYVVGDQRAEIRVVENGRASFVLEFAIFPSQSSQYRYTIVDARGKTRLGGPISAEQDKPVDLSVPGGVLPAGDYSLLVTDTGGVLVHRAEFTVR